MQLAINAEIVFIYLNSVTPTKSKWQKRYLSCGISLCWAWQRTTKHIIFIRYHNRSICPPPKMMRDYYINLYNGCNFINHHKTHSTTQQADFQVPWRRQSFSLARFILQCSLQHWFCHFYPLFHLSKWRHSFVIFFLNMRYSVEKWIYNHVKQRIINWLLDQVYMDPNKNSVFNRPSFNSQILEDGFKIGKTQPTSTILYQYIREREEPEAHQVHVSVLLLLARHLFWHLQLPFVLVLSTSRPK